MFTELKIPKRKKMFLNNERENTSWEKCGYDNEECI